MNMPDGWPTEEMIDKADAYAVSGAHEGNYRSYLAEIFRIMLESAPTPPAQDEPYAYALVSENHNTLIWARDKKVVEVCRKKYPNGKFIELFSCPQSDKLRKAAEGMVSYFYDGSEPDIPKFAALINSLRDALDKDRS